MRASARRPGFIPGGTAHPWRSPHVASLTQSVIAAIIIALFASFTGTNDPTSQAYLQLCFKRYMAGKYEQAGRLISEGL